MQKQLFKKICLKFHRIKGILKVIDQNIFVKNFQKDIKVKWSLSNKIYLKKSQNNKKRNDMT